MQTGEPKIPDIVSRPWKITLIVFTSLMAVVVVAGLVLYRYLSSPDAWVKVENIGGDWVVARDNPPIIEAGSHHPRLERLHGRSRRLVAKEPFPYKYIGDDCVIFTNELLLRAACGDVPPIVVAIIEPSGNRDLFWNLLWSATQEDPLRINGQVLSWAEIKEHARRGASFPVQRDSLQ